MFIYIRKYLSISFIALLFSCGECPVEQAPELTCSVHNVTIPEFNPRLIKVNDTTFYPVPDYSVETFQFPNDNSSSGSLPDDQRFQKNDKIIIAEKSFPNPNGGDNLRAVLYDIYPANSAIVGDMIVDSVMIDSLNPSNSTALLRFWGYVGRFPKDFPSEDATEFCQTYLKSYSNDEINNISNGSSQYGKGLSNVVKVIYSLSDIVVLNSKNQVEQGASVPVNVANDLLSGAESNAIHISVKIGEVYYYKAKNGRKFAVVVSDIIPGTLKPNKKKVSIYFSALN